jgi:hypothetical protein
VRGATAGRKLPLTVPAGNGAKLKRRLIAREVENLDAVAIIYILLKSQSIKAIQANHLVRTITWDHSFPHIITHIEVEFVFTPTDFAGRPPTAHERASNVIY